MIDWAEHSDEELSGYAQKLSSRRGYHKSIRIGELTTEMAEVVIPKLLPIAIPFIESANINRIKT